ncbi:hypothetical protein AB4K20DRAFT_1966286 [Rhizopus microsporus]
MTNNRLPYPPESESQLTHAQGLAKAENSILSPNVNVAQGFTFSGTDNGHHTMTDTVAFTLKRFKFHPELYNQYQVLGDVQNDDPHLADILKRYHSDAIDSECMDENVSYLDLPNSFKVKSEDIDFECGNWRRRRKLERDKKRAFEGQIQIQQKRFKLKLCASEQRFIVDQNGNNAIPKSTRI